MQKKLYIYSRVLHFSTILLFLSLLLEICSNLEFYGGKHRKKLEATRFFPFMCTVFVLYSNSVLYAILFTVQFSQQVCIWIVVAPAPPPHEILNCCENQLKLSGRKVTHCTFFFNIHFFCLNGTEFVLKKYLVNWFHGWAWWLIVFPGFLLFFPVN